MDIELLLDILAEEGVAVWTSPHGLRYAAPTGGLTEDLRAALAGIKQALPAYLAKRILGCSPDVHPAVLHVVAQLSPAAIEQWVERAAIFDGEGDPWNPTASWDATRELYPRLLDAHVEQLRSEVG